MDALVVFTCLAWTGGVNHQTNIFYLGHSNGSPDLSLGLLSGVVGLLLIGIK